MFDMHRRRDDDQPTPSPNADLERQISVLTQAVHRLEDAVLDRQALDSGVRHTVLRDIDIPFGSMVMLAMKWMLAYGQHLRAGAAAAGCPGPVAVGDGVAVGVVSGLRFWQRKHASRRGTTIIYPMNCSGLRLGDLSSVVSRSQRG
jgi:hypothetical protein